MSQSKEKSTSAENADDAIISKQDALALEREIDSVKRELKDSFDKAISRLDGLRKRLLDKAA